MFRSQQRKTRILFGLSDFLLTAIAFESAYRLRQALPLDLAFYFETDIKTLLLCFSALAWAMTGYWLDVYGRPDSAHFRVIVRDASRQVAYSATTLFVFIVFALHMSVSRVFLSVFIALSWLGLVIFRVGVRNLTPALRRSFTIERFVLIVGLGPRARRLASTLEEHYADGIRIRGFLAPPGEADADDEVELRGKYPVYPLAGLRAMLARHVIDEIHFAVESDQLPSLEEVFLWCDEEGVCTRLAVDFFPHVNSDLALERLGGTPMLTFTAAPDDEVLLLVKRFIDIVVALAAVVLLSPLLLLTALLVKVTSRGPVIFSQSRCGLNGRVFTCWKFRSMVVNAEDRFHEVAHMSKRDVATKIPNDPRLTPIGKWLRKFSIDEMPQLFNVMRGDMSIVGPRPAIPGEVAQYQRWQRRRLRMRPGMTCLWAIEGRDRVDFETWMRMDLEYIDNWSLGLDVRIMLLTIPEVLSGRGAS
jgi:exopolysaccharide biosynthesis polyprenyl glycosylphosphotransferase